MSRSWKLPIIKDNGKYNKYVQKLSHRILRRRFKNAIRNSLLNKDKEIIFPILRESINLYDLCNYRWFINPNSCNSYSHFNKTKTKVNK